VTSDGARPVRFARAALIGCGLIGGSLAAALRQAGAVGRMTGFDADWARLERAQKLGLIDAAAGDAAAAASEADLVIVAVPVRASNDVLSAIAPALERAELITDVGSTKLDVLDIAERTLPDPSRFCGGHPIAGTERSGPDAADANLFRDRLCIVTPTARTSPAALAACEEMWRSAGARTERMEAAEHDRELAWVSHLPHAAAFALAAAIGAVGDEVGGLWGGGFNDTTRIAASDPTMWRDIFLANRAPLLRALEGLKSELAALHTAVELGDAPAIEALIGRAHAGRRRVLEMRRRK
jgi:prephenate dehydrogenase